MTPQIAMGCLFTVVATNRGAHTKTLGCGMCGHLWAISSKMLTARIKRYGHLRCPHCGAELEAAAKR